MPKSFDRDIKIKNKSSFGPNGKIRFQILLYDPHWQGRSRIICLWDFIKYS